MPGAGSAGIQAQACLRRRGIRKRRRAGNAGTLLRVPACLRLLASPYPAVPAGRRIEGMCGA